MTKQRDSGGNIGFAREAQSVPTPGTAPRLPKATRVASVVHGGAAYAVIGVTLQGQGQQPQMRVIAVHSVKHVDNIIGAHHAITIAPADVLDHSYVIVCTKEQLEKFIVRGQLRW